VLHDVIETVTQNHMQLLTRMSLLDESFALVWRRFDDISHTVKHIPQGVKRKTVYEGFKFILRSQNDHITPVTNAKVSATRSVDNRTFEPCDNSVKEIGHGVYRIDFSARDLDGSSIVFAFRAPGADPCFHSINPL
jgi:hypothetical protein